jgi:hypothetical protein
MAATLAEELLFIAYDDTGRAKPGGSIELDCGMAGAVLQELSLAGRIGLVDGKVTILDATPVGDLESDAALGRIAGAEKGRKPDWWVSRLRFGMRNRMLARLVDSGALRMERRDVLWLFSSRRYFAVQAGVRTGIRARLEHVVVHGGVPDARTAALAALLNASGLARRTFPEVDRRALKTRMGELGEPSEGQWVSAAVRKAIQSSQSSA